MTAPENQFARLADQGRQASTTALESWNDTVQSLAGGPAQLPDLQTAVARYFDAAEQVLAHQRQFVHQWVAATTNVYQAVTEQTRRATQSVTAHTVNSAEAVVDNATDVTRAAGEDAAGTARTVRDIAGTN